MKTTTKARVQVTLEIDVDDSWSGGCDLAQVFDQASSSAIGFLRGHFNLCDGLVNGRFVPIEMQRRVRIIGVPHVIAVTSEQP